MAVIVHIVDTLCIGGRERLVVDSCNALAKAGHQLMVISLVQDNNPLATSLHPDVRFVALTFKEEDIIGLSFFKNALYLKRELTKALRNKLAPDVIHTHSYLHRLYLVQQAIKQSRKKSKVYHTVHTDGLYYASHDLMSRMKRQIELSALALLNPSLIAVSPMVQKNNLKYYGRVIKTSRFIPNGISFGSANDVDTDLLALSLGLSIQNDVLIYVARMVEGKNHSLLLDVFFLLIKRFPTLKLLLVGAGALQDSLQKQVKKQHMNKHVVFCGEVLDIKPYLKIAHIGVFPSSFEGFGLALIEKMAMGLPVVASSIPVFRYLIQDNVNGILFDLNDEKDFEDKLIHVISDRALRHKIGLEAEKKAREFDIEILNARLMEYYGV